MWTSQELDAKVEALCVEALPVDALRVEAIQVSLESGLPFEITGCVQFSVFHAHIYK